MYIVSKDEGVTEKETTADMRNRFCLDDESIKELAMLTIKTEELYGYPVDLEFGFAENKLYLLQAASSLMLSSSRQKRFLMSAVVSFSVTPSSLETIYISFKPISFSI